MHNKLKPLQTILAVFCLAFASLASARVANSPNFLDQRLLNPAASPLRSVFGSTFEMRRQIEDAKVLNLTDSSINLNTTIDSFESNSAWRTGALTWELNFVLQNGTKTTDSQQGTTTNSSTTSKLSLTPVQISGAGIIAKNLSVGLKFLYTGFDFNDSMDLQITGTNSTESVQARKHFSGSFMVVGPGFLYQLGATGFSLAYVAEFFQFKNSQDVQETNLKTSSDVSNSRSTNIQSTDTLLIRKDILGVGYLKKFSGTNNFRIDVSYEKMPPLSKTQGYPAGELYRVNAETNFSYVRVGAEFTNRTGYYVDPYNLIPYFFKVDHLGVSSVQEISFFGGLKTARGHGFGVAISRSTSTAQEQLSAGSSPQDIEKTNTKFGASYTYVF